jgi:hypothetical protein
MKKYFKIFLFISIIYNGIVLIISIVKGLPPLYSGYTIGYPTFFYYSSNGVDILHGFNKVDLIYNLIIISVISYIVYRINTFSTINKL